MTISRHPEQMRDPQKVAVFGLGYVGAVTAAGLAASGHRVVGVDVDVVKVEAIAAGLSPVVEPGIADLMLDAVGSGRLTATSEVGDALAGADISLVCVGTPSAANGATDLTFVSRALADIRAAMDSAPPPPSGHHSVVIRSTVPPGTGDTIVAQQFRAGTLPPGWSVGTAMCPEFLREGNSVADFFDPPFVVIGTEDSDTHSALARLFSFVEMDPVHVSVGTAEALKYACNAFHATKVSFANEMGRVFRTLGVDAREVMEVFCQDKKLNISPAYLRPGFAFGGSCLPKDLRSLQHMAKTHDVEAPLLTGTTWSNEIVVRDIVDRIVNGGHRTVALFGLSFKADTDDLRESPNVELAERLIGKGYDLRIFDPIVNFDRLRGANRRHVEARLPHLARLLASTAQEAIDGADVALVASSHHEVIKCLLTSPPKRIVDLNGRLGSDVEALPGFEGVGW